MARRDSLASYNAKRDFRKTAEPKGVRNRRAGHVFIVQKHDATRLHWDFRLEMDGVLKSWAVTRGPSLDPNDKRLAVRTEDHPMAYAGFEGTIPKGEYGGGTVMLWDSGTWEAVGGKDPAKTIEQGHVHVILHGERMKGEWLLVRMKPRGNEKRENWLLRKVDDDYSGASGALVETGLTSVKTGRTMAQIASGDDAVWHSDAKKAAKDQGAANAPGKRPPDIPARRKAARRKGKLPAFRTPQLATLVDHVPAGRNWLHEVKYDGYRLQLAIGGGSVRAFTRTGLDWSERFPAIMAAAARLPVGSALLDGEAVALDVHGRPNFSALQDALSQGGDLHYFAFDLLELDGEDLAALPNIERKQRLETLLADTHPPLHYAEHVTSSGEALFETLCREGYEGIVSKRADAPWRGTRNRNWLKVKCTRRQEFVILGYIDSDKAGRSLRSLALGLHDGDTLRYAGRVGTGFDAATEAMLLAKLRSLVRKTAPADVPRAAARDVHWVTPKLVAEVAFAEFTAENVVRHASFISLREDKPASDVTAETAVSTPDAVSKTIVGKPFGIAISHPDRIIDPDGKATKGELAAYYEAMAEPILYWLANRPVSLVRCPQGRARHCFFQKHDAGTFSAQVDHVAIREKDGKMGDYLVVNDGAGLLNCVQMGTIEFHGWGAPADDIEHPDRMIFDLDPDEGLGFDEVRQAAAQLRDLLGDMGLQSFPMASGGKGVHVVVPLRGSADWPMVKDFASRFSRAVAQAHPKRFTANMRKAERRGRIFIDWLRNERGSTAILPYSARARAGMPVAAPLSWDELAELNGPRPYSIADTATLLERDAGKHLKGWGKAAQDLPAL